ncbi:(Fe-S)-binding protein [Mesoterricola silvestris]|uniref:Fe-S oxidoreductase n=1 Tax=Mesoterricola silvestris TaxID=2927979 RepID=A0AA48K7N7_9BACT|nr:(Fe-S)-binding protein [Mesoterricola silvestris]BDU71315.1 Fe-S oxidoreductase [Mesoterricola silvestris]
MHPERVYFYGTCLVDLFYPEAGMAGIRLLRRAGVEVLFPDGQTCCGQPAFNCGYWEEARGVARSQVALFPLDIPVVLPSGSCAGMMRNHYPELFHGEPDEARVRAFSGRVFELTQFLVDVLEVKLEDLGEPVKVTWHSSCHALRDLGLAGQPQALLGQLANVEVAPLARERECCGFGGTFSVRHPEISGAMACDKAADAVATGASRVLSTDGGCLLNVQGALEAKGAALRAQHIAEFLWERTHAR